MGGTPPIGYDVVDGKLVANPQESKVVLSCFQIYLESTGLIEAILKLNRRGLKRKHFISRKGRVQEAKPWIAKQLHRVLTNPIYRGLVHHKESLYSGEHEAIVSEDLWEKVQRKLRENQPAARKEDGHLNEQAISGTKLLFPLKGFLHSVEGFALTPSYTNKSSKRKDGSKTRIRYRYYVSQQAIRQGYRGLSIRTLNAELPEEAVKRMLTSALNRLQPLSSRLDLIDEQIRHRLHSHSARIGDADFSYALAISIHALAPKIVVAENAIQIHLTSAGMTRLLDLPIHKKVAASDKPAMNVEVNVQQEEAVIVARLKLKRSRGHTRIFDGDSGEIISVSRTEPRPTLIQALAQGEFWRSKPAESPESSLAEVLRPYGVKTEYVRRLLNLAYLASDIKRAIMQGTQPTMLRVQDLLELRTMDWAQQHQELGFSIREVA